MCTLGAIYFLISQIGGSGGGSPMRSRAGCRWIDRFGRGVVLFACVLWGSCCMLRFLGRNGEVLDRGEGGDGECATTMKGEKGGRARQEDTCGRCMECIGLCVGSRE